MFYRIRSLRNSEFLHVASLRRRKLTIALQNIFDLMLMQQHRPFTHTVDKNMSNYEEAIQTLNTMQTNASVLQQSKNRKQGQNNTNVAETREFLQRSGVSQEILDRNLSIIHVAGTKGKGSTCAFTESILRHHGHRTGFFSSPHLVEARERIRINGEPLSHDSFTNYFWDVYNKLNNQRDSKLDMPPYFKFLTVMALNVFLEEKVDVAIIEVGIGGEHDCTNVIQRPVVVGITSLGLDHTAILGNTVELIAAQKAGIMKPGVPTFTVHPQPGQAMNILQDKSVEVQCSLTVAPHMSEYLWPMPEPPTLGLASSVQNLNASLAVQLAHSWLQHKFTHVAGSSNVLVMDRATAVGLQNTHWAGRAQILSCNSSLHFFLDGAHTQDSIENCLKWFKEASTSRRDSCAVTRVLLFNSTGDRDLQVLLQPLWQSGLFKAVAFCPNTASLTLDTGSDQNNFMVNSDQQIKRCKDHAQAWSNFPSEQPTNIKVFPCVADFMSWLEMSNSGQLHVLVTGSLHLVGCTLSILQTAESDATFSSTTLNNHSNSLQQTWEPLMGKVH